MPVPDSILAERYGCCTRTIRRLRKRGLDVEAVMDVGLFILGNPHSTRRMTESVMALIKFPEPTGGYEEGWKLGHTPQDP